QSSVATHKNVEFVLKNEIINRIEQSIEAVQNEQGISSGRALFLLKACKYNVQDTQNIPHKIMDDIYFSETKEASENKNKSTCLECQKELDQTAFNLECNHRYCVSCAVNYITEQFKQQEDENRVCCKCPFISCKERFGFKDFKKLLDEQAFKEYCKFLEDDALKIADYIIRCPSSDCQYMIVQIDQLSLKQSAKSMRCQCRTLFCSSCGSNAHEPLKCSTVKIFNKLEQEQAQIRNLKEKEHFYANKMKSSSQSNSYSFSSNFCPNGCVKLLVPKQDNPKLQQCPFCEGVFCKDCKQLYPCKCVQQEETKESMMEEEIESKKSSQKQVELPVVINYILPLLNTFTACKDNLLYVKVAKRKISAYLQNTLKFVSEKGKYESELNFVHSSLDVLEDLLLFIGHANLFLKIGASSKTDLLKFQLDELENQFLQLKDALTKDYNSYYKDLKPAQIFEDNFQNLKENVLAICNKVSRNQSSCASDFIGVNLNDADLEEYFKIYEKESPSAIAAVKKEQERIDSENKARNHKFGMMGFGDFGGDMMRGGRMHGYGGGYDHHPRGGGYQNRGMPKQRQQDSDDDDDDNYHHRNQNYPNYQPDSDDDDNQNFNQVIQTPQQKLIELLNFVQQKYPQHFEQVRQEKTYEDAFNKINELIKRNQPIYKSEYIVVILPKGIQIIERVYLINLEQENIQNNKILQEIINQHEDIFKSYDQKAKKILEITPWQATFFDYFEFLIMTEYKKLKPAEKSQIQDTCIACQKSLYPVDDEQFASKILSCSQNISDTDVIIIDSCQHPIHIGCYKPLVTPSVQYKCPCSLEYYRPIANNIKASVKKQYDYQYVEIVYKIPNQTINNVQIKAQQIVAYLYPYHETQSQQIYDNYVEAFKRGITFDLSDENKLQFRINHHTVAPPRFRQLIQDYKESIYELKKQLENFNIKPKF
ncbi:hypothetical protein ABPG74_019301, partial [Tetrahymena malaccensis]